LVDDKKRKYKMVINKNDKLVGKDFGPYFRKLEKKEKQWNKAMIGFSSVIVVISLLFWLFMEVL